jgi:hypothetical protein
MKKQLLVVGILFILITVGLSGCTQQNLSSDYSSIDQSKDQTPQTTESIQTILAKTETIESMYYEIVASINISEFGTLTALIKIWQKPPYLKEQITGVIDGVGVGVGVGKLNNYNCILRIRHNILLLCHPLLVPNNIRITTKIF